MFCKIKIWIKERLVTLMVIMQLAIMFPTWETISDNHSFQNKHVLCYYYYFFVLNCQCLLLQDLLATCNASDQVVVLNVGDICSFPPDCEQ